MQRQMEPDQAEALVRQAQQRLYACQDIAETYRGSSFPNYDQFYRYYKRYTGLSPMQDLRRWRRANGPQKKP